MAHINTRDLRTLQDIIMSADNFLKLGGDSAEIRLKLVHATSILTTVSDGIADPQLRQSAFEQYAEDGEIEIDLDPGTSEADDGTWVAAWVWVEN